MRAPEHRPPSPALDVLAVLAAQQQLDDLTDVVEAQQRTLQHLLDLLAAGTPPTDRTAPAGPVRTPSGGW